jgi:hypothetical protein
MRWKIQLYFSDNLCFRDNFGFGCENLSSTKVGVLPIGDTRSSVVPSPPNSQKRKTSANDLHKFSGMYQREQKL